MELIMHTAFEWKFTLLDIHNSLASDTLLIICCRRTFSAFTKRGWIWRISSTEIIVHSTTCQESTAILTTPIQSPIQMYTFVSVVTYQHSLLQQLRTWCSQFQQNGEQHCQEGLDFWAKCAQHLSQHVDKSLLFPQGYNPLHFNSVMATC